MPVRILSKPRLTCMPIPSAPEPSSVHTRASLLSRLRKTESSDAWGEFYQLDTGLIRNFALGAGLIEAEAEEVVQETMIAVARHLPEFQYNPKVCRFKTWLLNQTAWRIKDQIKVRPKQASW